MADVLYNSFKADIMNGNIDLDTDTIGVMLVTSVYTVNIDTHEKRSDITNEVAAGGGYTTKGKDLVSSVVTIDDAGDLGKWDADDLTWAASTITARGAVLYKNRGGASSADELIGFVDFVTDKSSTAGNFNLNWNTGGILTLT